jgi:acyl carrier protein
MTIEKIRQVFTEVFGLGPSEFSLTLSPDEVKHWDSLGHVKLISTIEERLSVKFEDDEIMEMDSVKKIIEILNKRGITC